MPGEPETPEQILAAVDLGSNSFHMVVARYEHGQLTIIDRLREMVRLAAGLDEQSLIRPDAAAKALACLRRFGQRLRDVNAANVRAVGTNTLRKAKNAAGFLADAEEALGHPIEVVSGREEARLVYLGAAHSLPEVGGRRLVIDIGGGSTELIVGEGLDAEELFSLYMGCVGITEKHFSSGKLSQKRWDKARLSVAMELEPVCEPLRKAGWDEVVGTSGTVRAVLSTLRSHGWSEEYITAEGLDRLVSEMRKSGRLDAPVLAALSADRVEVFAGGAVILQGLFAELGLQRMRVAGGALREGLLYDTLGRMTDEDARDRSVRALQRRFRVDGAQARRVEHTAMDLFHHVREAWKLTDPLAVKLLSWAARLHEIGLGIAHAKYHVHGAYLLEHSDTSGFSNSEKLLLARLVLAHRRKFRPGTFDDLPSPWMKRLPSLAVLLRLAVLLHRGRGPNRLPDLRLQVGGKGKRSIQLVMPPDWLESHPLTRADLDQEQELLRAADFLLEFVNAPSTPALSGNSVV